MNQENNKLEGAEALAFNTTGNYLYVRPSTFSAMIFAFLTVAHANNEKHISSMLIASGEETGKTPPMKAEERFQIGPENLSNTVMMTILYTDDTIENFIIDKDFMIKKVLLSAEEMSVQSEDSESLKGLKNQVAGMEEQLRQMTKEVLPQEETPTVDPDADSENVSNIRGL